MVTEEEHLDLEQRGQARQPDRWSCAEVPGHRWGHGKGQTRKFPAFDLGRPQEGASGGLPSRELSVLGQEAGSLPDPHPFPNGQAPTVLQAGEEATSHPAVSMTPTLCQDLGSSWKKH